MTNWEDQRKHKRAFLKLAVEYRSNSFWQMIEAQDVSAGGMFVATDKIEPPQTKIEVMFELGKEPHKKIVHAEGVVAWSRSKPVKNEKGEIQPPGMGIMFTKMTPSAAKLSIENMIKQSEDKGAKT